MTIFVCLKANDFGRPGDYFLGEEGEPLFKGRLHRTGYKGWKFIQTSRVPIEFHLLAPFIVEQNFQIPRSRLRKAEALVGGKPLSSEDTVKAQQEFQDSVRDVVDDELERRHRAADPAHTESWGETSKEKINRDLEKRDDEPAQ